MGKIYIIGLGPGDYKYLTLEAIEKIKSGDKNYLRTKDHPTVKYLDELGIEYNSFDEIYKTSDNFDEVYDNIVKVLIESAKEDNINYILPGNPLVAEKTTKLLLKRTQDVEIIHGVSFLEPLFEAVNLDPVEGFLLLDGDNLDIKDLDIHKDTIITQIYDKRVISDVKLKLSHIYSDEYPVIYVENAGMENETVLEIPIYKLDREIEPGLLSSLYIKAARGFDRDFYDFNDLLEIFKILRSEQGCSWDRSQDHQSIIKNLIEETFELAHALNEMDYDNIVEELGDVLLQVIFHAQIGEDEGNFDIYEIINILAEKLIYRHPHVFSYKDVENSKSIVYNWDVLKYQKREISTYTERLKDFEGLPSLLKSYKIQAEVAKIGFDWDDINGPINKIKEETEEVIEVIESGDSKRRVKEEIGDLLFSVVNLARLLDISPDLAIDMTSKKFIRRIEIMENSALKTGTDLKSMSLKEQEVLWKEAKEYLREGNEEEL